MTNRLLFGDDGSSHADSAWLWVQSHDWPDWSTTVVAVLAPEDADLPPRESLGPNGLREITSLRDSGSPTDRLRTLSAEHDLIVVGHKGRGFLKKLHLGSTAEGLMHNPPKPVIIVRGGHRTRRLLLAVDGSPHCRVVEAAVAQLPWLGRVDVKVIGVTEMSKDVTRVEEVADRLRGRAQSVTAEVVGPSDLQVFYRPADVLIDEADAWQADIIALGSRGLGRWDSLNEFGLRRAGSTAIAVAQSAPCSVMLGEAQT